MGLPVFRRALAGGSVNRDLQYEPTATDEVEDLYELLRAVKEAHPGEFISRVVGGGVGGWGVACSHPETQPICFERWWPPSLRCLPPLTTVVPRIPLTPVPLQRSTRSAAVPYFPITSGPAWRTYAAALV